MFSRFTIRTRLFVAFLGISFFGILAAAAALYSFLNVGRVLDVIAHTDVPEAIESLEISRRAERMVNGAPAMLTATSRPQLQQIHAAIVANGRRIEEQISKLKIDGSENRILGNMEWALGRLHANVEDMRRLIVERFVIREQRNVMLHDLHKATTAIVELLSEHNTLLDRYREEDPATSSRELKRFPLGSVREATARVRKAQEDVASINGTLLELELARGHDQLPALARRGQKALSRLEAFVIDLDAAGSKLFKSDPFKKQTYTLRTTLDGPRSIYERMRSEFDATFRAQQILDENSWLSDELSDSVGQLVDRARANIVGALGRVSAIQQTSISIIIVIVAISLLSSILVVWLYVGRNIVARLTELSECMESVAGGDLRVLLPSVRSNDEIGRMTEALTVFRDTAVEIEESNLREIGQARQRLMDAIESISEGFCYYDADDRLVVANNRYRSLMYPGAESTVVEGMTFEEVICKAAELGYIKDAEGRIDEWVAERMAQHREPGQPHIQQRGNGQWIMVSERKTGDRGTVGVYSDITELKEREGELAKKSESMEKLSNQIAKYVSPQIYDSIFTGKREVKVASHRRKLTVFFSDIAGFTETADQLESEELTALLNHYLTEMSDIATEYGATIDKYVGDAIVIFFGDPETRGTKEDALACVKMAIAMRQRMKALQGVWRDSGISRPLQCRIGINTGFCTVGNFGSETRMDYTIIGSGVNLASRLESAATPNEILISHETYALVKDEIRCESAGFIELKGISHPVETYQVVDLYEKLEEKAELIQEDSPNFNLKIDIDKLSADEHVNATFALRRALDKLGAIEQVEKTIATFH